MVTGVAALYLSENYNISAVELKNRILNNTDKDEDLTSLCLSGGKLNAYKVVHDHNFVCSYESINTKKHKKICECGYSIEEAHVFASGSFIGGKRYANCLTCGGLAEMGLEIITNDSNIIEFEEINGYSFVKETCYIDDILNLSYEDYLNYEK